ncbi:MAG: hypothetical protein ABI591_17785 [Kofleriaceae bacterium]
MRRLILALVLVVGACHHDPAPAAPSDPADKPPLPPASGTPIGFLIDDAGELKLSDDQVAKLRDIDTSLAADLEKIDAATRSANRPADSDPSAAPPPSGGRHGGRHGGGGMSGGMGGAGSSGHHKHSGGGSASPSAQASLGKLSDQRNGDVKDALERAFALLDDGQRVTAKKVLSDHDVDLDVGSVGGVPNNGAVPTAEPVGGEGDPRPEP